MQGSFLDQGRGVGRGGVFGRISRARHVPVRSTELPDLCFVLDPEVPRLRDAEGGAAQPHPWSIRAMWRPSQ